MSRLGVLLICIGDLAITTIFADKISGGSLQQHGNEYLMQVGSSLPAVLAGILMIPFVFLYKPKGTPLISSKPVSMWCRILAFIIDFTMALAIISPILAVPDLLVEWHETGAFAWSFTRQFPRESDSVVSSISIFLCFAWYLIYLAIPITKNRQTLGQYIIGFRISDASGRKVTVKRAVLRNVYGFIVISLWIITVPLGFYHPKKLMLHDNEDGLRPERICYV